MKGCFLYAWFSATTASTQVENVYAGTNITVEKPTLSMEEQTVTITYTLEEMTSTDNNHLQLAVYNSTLQTNGENEIGERHIGWENAYVDAAGRTVWNDVSGLALAAQPNAYGVKGSGDNVNYKVYEIFATADSDYQADVNAQEGFAAFAKRISFTIIASSPTAYWCVDQGGTAPTAGTVGTAVPTAKQTVDFTLAAKWAGGKTSVGYVAIYANGAASTFVDNVSVGFANEGMAIGTQS